MNAKTEFPFFYSPCPTKDEIFTDYVEREHNNNANSRMFCPNPAPWIPPPAKTTKAPQPSKVVKTFEISRNRRSKSWDEPEKEERNEEIKEKGTIKVKNNSGNSSNWSQMRRWVSDIDRSIENLSNSVRGLLKEGNAEDKEQILFHHTPVKDRTTYEGEPARVQHLPVKENSSHGIESTAIDRLTGELKRARDELHQAETRQASLEALKSHLQLQLRQRSAQCERMTAQMRNSASKTRQTVVQLTQELAAADARIHELMRQRELLKHAAKGQKRRAMKAEAEIARMKRQEVGNGNKGDPGEDTTKAIAQLEEDNKRLRDLTSGYEDRLAVTEKEVENLRERLAQTESRITESVSKAKTENAETEKVFPEPPTQIELSKPQTPSTDTTARLELTIQELRNQLAQSDASNRNLQAYLSFLKRSYNCIFEADDLDKGAHMATTTTAVVSVTPEVRASDDTTAVVAE
ncbi:Outer dense fiber protein 2 [Echinococcus granulosus]|uniref:Outer dense fiber protein 2 n=1 Tax=Echinococcus granulosus TaxID=6210 RepID=W6U998_ECHGR|nr:Outer dense fiber protein 2 [Echinococcus granulosus]EUB57086.1 Outer dense fiber protein 2 [Echinococcus granulosus]